MTHRSLAQRLFDATDTEAELENTLYELGITCERTGWDDYDNSLELHGVETTFRLNENQQQAIAEMGFATCYVNHTDYWETHYTWSDPFSPVEGWRVSYPHVRKPSEDDDGAFWVEKKVESWPEEWFVDGSAVVKEPKG